MVLQTPHGRHRAVVGLVELKLTGLRNPTIPAELATREATAEPPGSGEVDGGMSDRVRSFAVQLVDLMDCLSARRVIAGTARGALLRPSVRLALFLTGPGPEKRLHRASSTTSVKTVSTDGPPTMANSWTPRTLAALSE